MSVSEVWQCSLKSLYLLPDISSLSYSLKKIWNITHKAVLWFVSTECDDSYFCKCMSICKENTGTEEWQTKNKQTKIVIFLSEMQLTPLPVLSVFTALLNSYRLLNRVHWPSDLHQSVKESDFSFKSPLLQGLCYFLPFPLHSWILLPFCNFPFFCFCQQVSLLLLK